MHKLGMAVSLQASLTDRYATKTKNLGWGHNHTNSTEKKSSLKEVLKWVLYILIVLCF